MYTDINFPHKKALKDYVKSGGKVKVFQPNAMFPVKTENGEFYLEGPHYPKPHTWYAKCTVKEGYITKVN